MEWYPWLNTHFYRLVSSYKLGYWHHAFIIQTVSGIGDETLIYEISCFLMCQHSKEYKSCEKCHNCQLMKAGTHPDYYVLSPDKDKNSLGIDEIRKISENLYECAKLGGKKIVRISNLSFLTESAVYALLKILEDPPKETWFSISFYGPGRLLSTLRSRCFLYYLHVPQESEALVWLMSRTSSSEKETLSALRLCNGAPIAALELLNSALFLERKHLYILFKEAIENHDLFSLLTNLNHNKTTEYLSWLISLFLDALKMQYGISLISNVDSLSLVNIISHCFSDKDLLAILYEICNCYKILLTTVGVDHELLLANQLLRIEHYLNQDNKVFHLKEGNKLKNFYCH